VNGDLDRVVAWLEWWVWIPARTLVLLMWLPVMVAGFAWWLTR
jgi:hypothetical protein